MKMLPDAGDVGDRVGGAGRAVERNAERPRTGLAGRGGEMGIAHAREYDARAVCP